MAVSKKINHPPDLSHPSRFKNVEDPAHIYLQLHSRLAIEQHRVDHRRRVDDSLRPVGIDSVHNARPIVHTPLHKLHLLGH